ncbi:hypothetical protein OIDMADRAFT_101942 [Oidiodendron maius Zn]|uniref:Peptidase A1 domain-containing protein n=1 Tax=Oidiodendron maius (strain Zn) TaxID=913774 RepID=A0A0C3DSY7_OIDMZ|nr:hypothetical protein OIDMADRAFT_101942 [Oidiodendron maius Zn]
MAMMNAFKLAFADCVPYPIAAKIGNVTLSNGQTARGISYSVGTPEQDFAFLPQWPLNNVMVYGTDGYCTSPAPSTEVGCTTWRGGQYNKVASTTRQQAGSGSYPSDASQYPNRDYVTDTMVLNQNISLSQLDMGIPLADWGEQGYYPMMAIGLGQNSTILSALVSAKNIVSRTWSMFYGWTGDDSNSQLDGTFVFGGYDRAKVTGQGYTFATTANPACDSQLMVTIEDMILNFPNGTTTSLFTNPSESIAACILPDYPVLMTIALDPYFNTFQILTNTSITDRSFGLAYFSMLYGEGDQPYQGDLTFNIQSGPSIRIPNNQLVVSERSINQDSGALEANSSARNLVINPVQSLNANDLPKLGRQFLSSAYIMMNQDANQFTLWSSNPTSAVDLVAVSTNGTEVTDFCTDAATTPSSTPQETTPPSSASGKKAALSAGPIAGIAIGAVAVVAIVAVAAFIFYRRRRDTAKANNAGTALQWLQKEGPPGDTLDPLTGTVSTNTYSELPQDGPKLKEYFKPELHGTPSPRTELRMSPQQRYELVG